MNNEARFWSRVDKTPTRRGCWLWKGGVNAKSGYGQITINMERHAAHRLAYQLTKGEIEDGLQVRHTCDVRVCCNPEHLIPGTHQDNMDDRRNRGRTATGLKTGPYTHPEKKRLGENHGNARLTASDVLSIRASSLTQMALARRHRVSQAAISRIVLRKGWKHI